MGRGKHLAEQSFLPVQDGIDFVDSTIADIWDRVRKDDTIAWEQLVTRYLPLVLAVAHRSGLGRLDAEDCAQYTWQSLYRSRHAIKDPQCLPAWLIRVASRRSKRILLSAARETSRRRESRSQQVPALPDEDLIRFERAAMLQTALSRMEPRCRNLLKALFFSDKEMSYEDIARQLKIPVNSMGPTRARCLEKLRKVLTDLGY